jgi:hypothetical protein
MWRGALVSLGVDGDSLAALFDILQEVGVKPDAGLYVVPGEELVLARRNGFELVATVLVGFGLVDEIVPPSQPRSLSE